MKRFGSLPLAALVVFVAACNDTAQITQPEAAGSPQFAVHTPVVLVTYEFEGTFVSTDGSLFNSGDTFSGSYTFDPTVAVVPHPDPTLDIQAVVILGTLPGTGWTITVFSSAVGEFSLSGSTGVIALGNNTAFGDRYIATLSGAGPLPLGLRLSLFQIDLFDPTSDGADMLANVDLDAFPILSLATSTSARFNVFIDPGFCTQCFYTLTSFTSAVQTPAEATQDLIDDVGDLVAGGALSQGQGNALTAKLDAALKQLDRDNTAAAINQLGAFINQVNAFVRSRRLTEEEGQSLIDSVQAIIDALAG